MGASSELKEPLADSAVFTPMPDATTTPGPEENRTLTASGPGGLPLILRTLQRWILLGTVALLPLTFIPSVLLDIYNLPKVTFVMVSVALAGALRAASTLLGQRSRNLRLVALPAATMAGAFILAWAFAEYPIWSLLGSYTRYGGLLPYLAVILFTVLLADAFAGSPRPVVVAAVLGGAGVGMGAVIQMLFFGFEIGRVSQTAYVTSTIGHSNFLGGYLAIVLAMSVALWLGEGRLARFGMISTIPVFCGLLFTVSQGAWLAAIAALMVVAGRHLRRRGRWAGKAAILVGGLIGVAGAVAVGVTMLIPHALARLPSYLHTAASRGLLWDHAVALGLERPLLGWGPNAFAVEGPLHRSVEDALLQGFTQGDDPHSVPLALFANIGLIGVAAFLFTLVWAFKRAAAHEGDPVVATAVVGGLVAYTAQALVSIDEITMRFNFWVLVAASACLAATPDTAIKATPPTAIRTSARRMAPAMAGAAILLGGALAYTAIASLVIADAHVARGLRLSEVGAGEGARAEFQKALELRDDNAYRRAYGHVLGQMAYAKGPSGKPLIDEMDNVFSYLDGFPDPQTIALWGQLTYQWSLVEPEASYEALELYTRALQLDPYNPNAAREKADILMGLGRAEEAEDLLEPYEHLLIAEFPEFSPLYGEFWAGLAIARARQGKTAEARETFERAGTRGGCRFVIASILLEPVGQRPDREILDLLCPRTLFRLLPANAAERAI